MFNKADIVAQFCTCIYMYIPSLYVCICSTELTKPVYIGTRTLELLVSVPDPTHYARKGLVTFEGFLGCAHPHVLIQQARDLHVPIHFVYKIFTVSACREPVYVCVASLFSVLLINCQRNQISRSDQGRSNNGVYACANAYL